MLVNTMLGDKAMYSANQVWIVIKDFPELDQVRFINQASREVKINQDAQTELLKLVCARLSGPTFQE